MLQFIKYDQRNFALSNGISYKTNILNHIVDVRLSLLFAFIVRYTSLTFYECIFQLSLVILLSKHGPIFGLTVYKGLSVTASMPKGNHFWFQISAQLVTKCKSISILRYTQLKMRGGRKNWNFILSFIEIETKVKSCDWRGKKRTPFPQPKKKCSRRITDKRQTKCVARRKSE